MPVSTAVPYHLVVGARAGFMQAYNEAAPRAAWARIAQQINLTAKSVDFVNLGAAPMPTESLGGQTVQTFIEKHIQVSPKNWDITVGVSRNAIADDQTAALDQTVRSAGDRFNEHFDKLCYSALNAGDAATYGLCYDGLNYFSNSHLDKGADYTSVQDNLNALSLTLTNFNTVWTAAMNYKDDRGEVARFNYDLLIVPPALVLNAAQITDNAEDATTGNRAMNPFNGKVSYLVSQDFDATAWALVASSQRIKPIQLIMREAPHLPEGNAWYDPQGPDGGMFYFKFVARYNIAYGEWRLSALGNT